MRNALDICASETKWIEFKLTKKINLYILFNVLLDISNKIKSANFYEFFPKIIIHPNKTLIKFFLRSLAIYLNLVAIPFVLVALLPRSILDR